MANLCVRDFPTEVKQKLKEEGKANGRSLSAQLIWLLKERYNLLPTQKQQLEQVGKSA